MAGALTGRRIVVPETRELDLLIEMLERQGASAIRCPLVSIHDTPDEAHVMDWLGRFLAHPADDIILLTGEALLRLLGFARRNGIEASFRAALAQVRRITRGPKPVRQLREIGLETDIAADPPTSDGIISALAQTDLSGRRVAIALYPDFHADALFDFLRQKGATPDPVLAYVYGSATEDARVLQVIDDMAAGRVDLVTFTSSPQVRRLQEVARSHSREGQLRQALVRTAVAAVGPVVGRAVEAAGGRVAVMPERFHMKPLVKAIVEALGLAR